MVQIPRRVFILGILSVRNFGNILNIWYNGFGLEDTCGVAWVESVNSWFLGYFLYGLTFVMASHSIGGWSNRRYLFNLRGCFVEVFFFEFAFLNVGLVDGLLSRLAYPQIFALRNLFLEIF